MIAYIDHPIKSRIIHNTRSWHTPDEILSVFKEYCIHCKADNSLEDYTTLEIQPQKITIDEYAMQRFFQMMTHVFRISIVYANTGHEDFCIRIYDMIEEPEDD